MHELGIAEGIFKQMLAAARQHGLTKVDRVVFKLGALAGVEGHHLAEHLDELSPGTPLEGVKYEFLELQPGDALSPEEAGQTAADGQALRATGMEIIISQMEGS